MKATTRPYREEDLEARLAALLREHEEIVQELKQVRAEIASLRPWNWGRFALGAALIPGATALIVCVLLSM